MEIRKGNKHVSFHTLPEIKGAIVRAASRIAEHEPEGTKEEGERYQTTHHVEAVMCWLLVQPQEVQDKIILEGRSIARKLKALPAPAEDFPEAYRELPSTAAGIKGGKGGQNRGHDTVGRATSVEDVIARERGKPKRGAGGEKKRPKTNGRPLVGVGE